MKENIKNPKVLIPVGLIVLMGGFYYSKHRVPPIPTTDEFFKNNPQLSQIPMRKPPIPDQLRESDQFKEGDYQILKNQIYQISFSLKTDLAQPDQKEKNYTTDGQVFLWSGGIKKGRLWVLAEFFIKKLEGAESINPNLKKKWGMAPEGTKADAKSQQSRTLRVGLDPQGIIRELYSNEPEIKDALEVQLLVLDTVFKKIAPIKVGTEIRSEQDATGISYSLKSTIQDQGDQWLIEQSASDASMMGGNESKLAASGLQGVANQIVFEVTQSQSLKFLWSKDKQVPVQQNYLGVTQLKQMGQVASQFGTQAQANWKFKEEKNYPEDAEKIYRFPISLAVLRAEFANKRNLAKKGSKAQFKTWSDLQKDLRKLQDKKLENEQIDELLKELSQTLRADPSRIPEIKELARSAVPGSREVSVLMGALGYEGSAASQEALIDLYRREGATLAEKNKVMVEFTLARQPLTEATKSFLVSEYSAQDPMKNDIASTAGLAIGSSISKDGDPNMIRFVHQEWNRSQTILGPKPDDLEKQRYLLSVMGNSKSNVFLPEIKSAAESDQTILREGAATAVRFAQDTESRNVLMNFLTDKNTNVRMVATDSLQYQPYDEQTKSALQNCAVNDPAVGVKINCYRILGNQLVQPGVREFLSSRLGAEVDAKVKAQIESSLKLK